MRTNAPIPSASVDLDSGITTADRQERSFAPPYIKISPSSSDQFKQTSDRPFPTAREDAPQ
jgi:hypothetical protein